MSPISELNLDETSTIAFSEVTDDDIRTKTEDAVYKAFAELAVDGEVDIAVLYNVFASMHLQVDSRAMDEATRQFFPTAQEGHTSMTLQQALAISRHLAKSQAVHTAPMEATNATQKSSSPSSLGKLLFTVIFVMFLSTSVASGLAILWLWLNTLSQDEQYARVELDLNVDMLDVMVHQTFQNRTEKVAFEFAQTIGSLVKNMGYGLTSASGKNGLSGVVDSLAHTIDTWWQREGGKVVQGTASMLKKWVATLFATVGVTETARLAALFNSQAMPPGCEMLLGQWANGNNSAIQYLYPRRFTSQCLNGTCIDSAEDSLPMRMALWGYEGGMRGLDYRPKMVHVSYTYFAKQQVGMVFKMDLDLLQASFQQGLKAVMDAFNTQFGSMIGGVWLAQNASDGTKQLLTAPPSCKGSCYSSVVQSLYDGSSPLGMALRNQAGKMDTVDYSGVKVFVAYAGVPGVGLGLEMSIASDSFSMFLLLSLGMVLQTVNAKLAGTSELELVAYSTDAAGNWVFTNLTAYRFAKQCMGQCNVSTYIRTAAQNCSTGVTSSGADYRGKPVIAGYTCIPELGAIATFKVDQDEVAAQGQAQVVQATDQLNQNEVSSSFELLLGKAKGLLDPSSVMTDADVQILTKLKSACNSSCGGTIHGLMRALQGFEGILYGKDYRGVEVLAATAYVESMLLGLQSQVDMSELMSPIITKALMLMGITLGSLVVSTLLLALYTRKMVLSMVKAEQEGQDAILIEKQRFSALVESMYPAYVVPRLLSGERQIVQMLPHTAVFFSDIHNFTSAANNISSEELLSLMGYTYGVMDQVADQFHITKVKTVGDAYLAISGLPGNEDRNCTLDMLRFAACVAQVFSCKFDHPRRGDVLALLQSAPNRQPGGAAGKMRTSFSVMMEGQDSQAAPPSAPAPRRGISPSPSANTLASHNSSNKPGARDPYAKLPKVRCLMSYGIAAGPVTAGVLQGKNPMFDIWGKTVNLASRMQSTSQPGRIQVSDLFYRSVIASGNQLFTFEASHDVICKGFGLVKSYFVKDTNETPPKELLVSLGLKPNLGLFFFENAVPGYRKNPASATEGQTSSPEGIVVKKAVERPPVDARPLYASPRPIRKAEPLVLQGVEDA